MSYARDPFDTDDGPEPWQLIERPGVTIKATLAELLGLDANPQVEADWQAAMKSIAEAEARAWAARDLHKLEQFDGFTAGFERAIDRLVPTSKETGE